MVSQAFKDNFSLIDFSKPLPEIKKPSRVRGPRSNLAAPMILGDYEAYECPVSGAMIDGKSAHRENLKRTGCRILEPGETENVKKNGKKLRDEMTDKAVDVAFDQATKEFDL